MKNVQVVVLAHHVGTQLSQGSAGAAGYDLCAAIEQPITLAPGDQVSVPTGIKLAIGSPKWCAVIIPRSGLGAKGLVLANLTGLIDSDYRGEIKVCLWNRNECWAEGEHAIVVHPGDRIAQLVFLPVGHPQFDFVTDFADTTDRGDGGFGSTGIA